MPKIQAEVLNEKISVGGGATGKSEVPDPVGGTATLPNSKKQGDSMPKIDAKGTASVETTDTENNVDATDVSAEKNKATIKSKIGVLTTKAEDIEAMFSGEEISEEFKAKAAVVYEAAVNSRVEAILTEKMAELEEKAQEEVATAIQEMADELNEALDFAVNKWMEDNQVAIVSSLRANITEEFIGGLKQLFEANYIDIPEEKVDAVEELASRVAELEGRIDESTKREMELQKALNEHARKEALAQVSEGMTATQVEKLNSLAEGVEFDTAEGFKKKLEIVKESYFPATDKGAPTSTLLEQQEQGEGEETKPVPTGPMAHYVKAISRIAHK